jgi:hypothetical protein
MTTLVNSLVEKVNRFRVRCDGCQHYYQTAVIAGLLKVVHAKVDPNHLDNASLPTKQCRLMYDYVLFDPCGHCCPEVFALCPEPHATGAGKPTQDNCSG